jgi:hypothetical protein
MSQHDMLIDNQDGTAFLIDINAALKALASCSSGPTAPVKPYAGMFWLDTSIPPDGYLRMRNTANSAWVEVAGKAIKATDTELAGGNDTVAFVTSKQVAQKQAMQRTLRNRLINPAMQISQENGDIAGTTNSYHMADQWMIDFTGGAVSGQRVASATPRGSKYRLRLTVTTAVPALGTSDHIAFSQLIEGNRVADFQWGSAAAKQCIVRFGFRGPAGTYSLSLRSWDALGANRRSYIRDFTVSAANANKDIEVVAVIPGATTGTWITDIGRGLWLTVTMACGSALIGAADTWLSGNWIASSACSNGMAALNTFELFDAGVYLDADASGMVPRWDFPDEVQELLNCQRYYVVDIGTVFLRYTIAASTYYAWAPTPVDLRTTPTITMISNVVNSPAGVAASGSYTFYAPRTIQEGRACPVTAVSNWASLLAANARL